jgi:RNA polymerase sigma-70 factor (ECF subfamily)
LTHNKALAEDVVQEALLRAWKYRNSLLHESAAKAWLCTIIRNEYARTFERERLAMVDVDSLIATEEPALSADEEQDLDDIIREALRGYRSITADRWKCRSERVIPSLRSLRN